MTKDEEIEYYKQTLENGLFILCDAVGVNTERYDTDQADSECYLDCFKEMAEALKMFNVGFDEDEGQFVIKSRGEPNYTVWMEERGFTGAECFDSLLISLLSIAEVLSNDKSIEPVFNWQSEPTEDKAIWEITLKRHPAF